MTGTFIIGLILIACGMIAMFFVGRDNVDLFGVVLVGLALLFLGLLLFSVGVARSHQGYALNKCETGTYKVATVDNSNKAMLYITVRDYKDYALRLCAIPKENVHQGVLQSKNVRLILENGDVQLYPAE